MPRRGGGWRSQKRWRKAASEAMHSHQPQTRAAWMSLVAFLRRRRISPSMSSLWSTMQRVAGWPLLLDSHRISVSPDAHGGDWLARRNPSVCILLYTTYAICIQQQQTKSFIVLSKLGRLAMKSHEQKKQQRKEGGWRAIKNQIKKREKTITQWVKKVKRDK
jgi:hypothetical protein